MTIADIPRQQRPHRQAPPPATRAPLGAPASRRQTGRKARRRTTPRRRAPPPFPALTDH